MDTQPRLGRRKTAPAEPTDQARSGQAPSTRGLKGGALSYAQSVAMGISSTAPAYSLAATLGFVALVVGLQLPVIVLLAFIPMFFSSWANKEMNNADPDCGSSFIWAARALGPRIGWFAGGWGTIAADLLGMASYAQIAGQYLFLFLGLDAIGQNPTSPWVLLVGVLFLAVLTYMCYRGIQVSARTQVVLVVVEVVMLAALSVVAIVRLAAGTAPATHLAFSLAWFNPLHLHTFSGFIQGMLLMVFVYWGWDTTVSVNEETKDSRRIPGNAGVISTVLLLVLYALVSTSVQSYAGDGTRGIGLDNPNHEGDVLSVMGDAVFGHSVVGTIFTRLLLLMVLSSAVGTTQTTILPNARTTVSMAFHKALPAIFGRIHPRYLTPTFSTISFSVVSIIGYVVLNYVSGGNIIADSVTACTFFVAVYLGITGFACTWFYRKILLRSAADFVLKGLLPLLSGLMLFGLLGWSVYFYGNPNQSDTTWLMPFVPHWQVGGVLSIAIITTLAGLAWMETQRRLGPGFFKGQMQSEVALTDDGQVIPVGGAPD
jgi:amino acid transporter